MNPVTPSSTTSGTLAARERDHGGADQHGFDHDEAERLFPVDGKQKSARPLQESELVGVADFAEPRERAGRGAGGEPRRDVAFEVVRVLGVGRAGEDELGARGAGGVDRDVGRLLGGETSDERYVAPLAAPGRKHVDVDAVVDDVAHRNFGAEVGLTLRDPDVRDVRKVAVKLVERFIAPMVEREHERHAGEHREGSRRQLMSVDDLEWARARLQRDVVPRVRSVPEFCAFGSDGQTGASKW